MWPATTWDDADWGGQRARGWTVMGRLRQRQRQQQGPSVIACLFAPPDTESMQLLDARGDYFDVRTGDTWDLFFPGYYRSPRDRYFERQTGAQPVGHRYNADLYFQASDFNMLRQHIERSSKERWQYSGGTDLVLINVYFAERGEPTVDWESTISGQVADGTRAVRPLTLANAIERISRDLEAVLEDPAYGVGDITIGAPETADHSAMRDLMVNALGGIAAAIAGRAMGI